MSQSNRGAGSWHLEAGVPLMAACTQSGHFSSLVHGVSQGSQLLQLKPFNPYTCVCVCVCVCSVVSNCGPEL